MSNIAIIGSSGGNLFNLGGKDPKKLLNEIIIQANSAKIDVTNIVFVGAKESMDNIKPTTKASLFTLENTQIISSDEKLLNEINEMAREADKNLAVQIKNGKIDGIVVMSADPKNINKESFLAAIEMKTPIVGTGGTAMANIQNDGANVISVSGTTGTTNRTRAISAIASLSKEFGLSYRPIIGSIAQNENKEVSIINRISIRGIMMASLPGFIAMSIILALSKIEILGSFSKIFDILIATLPVIVAAIAAKQVSGLDEIGIVAGIVAGALSTGGGLIGGIIGGILAGIFAILFIRISFNFKIPGTTANIISGGISGLLAGLIIYYFIGPLALKLGENIRFIIDYTRNLSPALAGLVAGVLIWPAIMGGVYHAAILPIVLLEMELTGMSFLGAIDMVGLVMVSAGINLANIIAPRKKENRSLAVPGFFINIAFGTFVEAAYPFMFSNKLIMLTAILSAGVSGLVIGILNVNGTAYVPSLVAPGLSNNVSRFIIAMLVALFMSMILTILINKFTKEENKND